MSKVLAYILPYAAWSPVPVRLLEKGGAPAVRLVVAALSSASLGDVTATSNVEAGLRTFIQAFQVGVALEAHLVHRPAVWVRYLLSRYGSNWNTELF